MTQDEAFMRVIGSLKKVVGDKVTSVTIETHLTEEGILDSLDTMSFLFELEQDLGHKISGIDDDFSDFRVTTIVNLMIS